MNNIQIFSWIVGVPVWIYILGMFDKCFKDNDDRMLFISLTFVWPIVAPFFVSAGVLYATYRLASSKTNIVDIQLGDPK